MPTIDLFTNFAFHPLQLEIHNHPARFKVLDCGRRWGKTKFDEAEGMICAGNGGYVGYFVPKYKYLSEVWRDFKNMLEPAISAKSEQEHRIELVSGGLIECWSLENEDAGQSRAYDLAIVDEAALGNFMRHWQRNIRPTLTDRRGKAIFTSTPRGINWFFEIYQRGQNPQKFPGWMSWKLPSATNPYFLPEELDDARATSTAQIFAQEYLAEFLTDETATFRNLENCWFAVLQDKPIARHTYVMGMDVARVNDWSVVTVIDLDTVPASAVLIDASQGVAFDLQMARLYGLWERFNPATILIEKNANLQMIEKLHLMGLPVQEIHTTNLIKVEMVNALAMAFENRQLFIPKDDILIGQLQAYASTRTLTGMVRYAAPEGQYDDYVMSLMLANWAAQGQGMGEAGFYEFR